MIIQNMTNPGIERYPPCSWHRFGTRHTNPPFYRLARPVPSQYCQGRPVKYCTCGMPLGRPALPSSGINNGNQQRQSTTAINNGNQQRQSTTAIKRMHDFTALRRANSAECRC
jgi:hypothetical protein